MTKVPKDQSPTEVLYRYVDRVFSRGVNEFDDPLPGYTLRVELREYQIVKRTPSGAWIYVGYSFPIPLPLDGRDKRFIRLTARKKFACETKEEAMESFRARKVRQIEILRARLRKAEDALEASKDSDFSVTNFGRDFFIE